MILPFKHISLRVPRAYLRNLFYAENMIYFTDIVKIKRKIREIEKVENQLAHVRSIAERILERKVTAK